MRELKGALKTCVAVWAAMVSVFHLYTAVFGVFQPRIQRGVHLLFLLPLAFILYPFSKKKSPKDRPSVFDWILAFLSLLPALYIIYNNNMLNMRMLMVERALPIEVVLGALNIILILEAIRRVVVPAMAILVVVFLAYIFIAPLFPQGSLLYARAFRLSRIIEMNYLVTDVGIYGSIIGVTATFVAIFVIFGAFMQYTKTGEFFTNLACRLAGNSPGGPAKIAVVSSAFFGSISGVAAANVYATGVFTIPLMKKLGYRAQFAGAVEAASSTGGLILPPIMGAGAFVMAELTGIPYATIAISAALGAILYYVSIGLRVHFIALKEGLKSVDKEDMISWKQVIMDSYLLAPMVVLIIFLARGYSPFGAATASIATTFLLSFIRKETRLTPKRLFEAFTLSGYNLVMLAVCCAGAGIVVSAVTYTSLALKIATVITSFAGGMLFPALALVMLTSLVLGMGLPCTPAYIIAVTIGGPAMMALGINRLPAHLFVFYFAILAEVTPPVCIAAYCGAAIAGTPPMATGFEASKLAIMGYIIPFIFVYNSALLMQGSPLLIIATFLGLIMVCGIFAAGISRYLFINLKQYQGVILMFISAGASVFLASPVFLETQSLHLVVLGIAVVLLILFFIKNSKVSKAVMAS